MGVCVHAKIGLLVFSRCSDDYRTSQLEWSKPEPLSVVILHGMLGFLTCYCTFTFVCLCVCVCVGGAYTVR